jgi:hypothetical protein
MTNTVTKPNSIGRSRLPELLFYFLRLGLWVGLDPAARSLNQVASAGGDLIYVGYASENT